MLNLRIFPTLRIGFRQACVAATLRLFLVHLGQPAELELAKIVDGVKFPSQAIQLAGSPDRWHVVEHHTGRVWIVEAGVRRTTPFLDLSDRIDNPPASLEEGINAIAFPPDFSSRRHVFVTYTSPDARLNLSRFDASSDGLFARPDSEQFLLRTRRWSTWHHCGYLEFSPRDAFFYACVGDSDRHRNQSGSAQDISMLQGSILRIDPYGGDSP